MVLRIEKIYNFLSKKGYRLTKIRRQIIKIIVNSNHITINDLRKQLKYNTNITVNITSIYNTIDMLLNEHIIHVITNSNQKFYELQELNIIHLICQLCKKVIEINRESLNTELETFFNTFLDLDVIQKLNKLNHFVAHDYVLEIHGYCQDCQNKLVNTI